MEALHSSLTTGEQSGGQEHRQRESLHLQPKSPSKQQQHTDSPKPPHGAPQQPKQSKRQLPERKRLRAQRQSVDSDTNPEHKQKETNMVSVSEPPPSTTPGPNPFKPDNQEGTPKQKRERKPQKPGKYVCTYCGRACAKPSVLQKHIRSHTGERPYPCPPCGFSFKTKSNLYKHRKSHTHRVKAGLAVGEPRPLEEQITESEDEARHLSSASSISSIKNPEANQVKDGTTGHDDSYAVRKRLAMRLSRGKHAPKDSTEDKTMSLILGSKESTESGYFSRSESTEQSQDIYPNTSAKSYAEIILGKYGRLGHLHRMSRQNNQQSSSQEDKSVPFTVPKKQVIDHITKLITINEAVVDTSKIDSVKPRRFSLSRKNSDSQKSSSLKEPLLQVPKPGELLYKSSGSITMGVPCEKFQHHLLNVEPSGQTSPAPLLRSHSMPSSASSTDVATVGSNKFRLSQSFDERQPSESQVPRRYGMLRRQPAIDGEPEGSHSFFSDCMTTVPDHKQSQPQPYECETCGTGCKDWEGYKKHKQTMCLVHRPRNEVVISQMECSQIITHAVRPGALALRKRRKAESFEFDDPTSPSLSSGPSLEQCNVASNIGYEGPRRPTIQTCSVIQHTSSFEKQESLSESKSTEPTKDCPLHRDQDMVQKQPELTSKLISRKLVCQHNVLVPEILVTEDSNTSPEIVIEPSLTSAKQLEKSEEFQWPQRSSSLAQLPIEKLPPKKKRLRLAEAAQSSGESSFESISLPHSPSQDSSASYASSRSTSFEESNRLETENPTSTSLRKSRALHMLTVPGVHPHREMRRSASEQAPHDPQPQNVVMAETRSKSFDYSSLSPERSAIGWRERRKCLLIRHTAVRDPDEDEEQPSSSVCSSEKVTSTPQKSSVYCSNSPCSPLRGETISHYSQNKEMAPQWKPPNVKLTRSPEAQPSDDPLKEEALKISKDQLPSQTPNPTSTHGLSGAARAHYLPVSTGLKLEIPSGHSQSSSMSHSHMQHSSVPQIISSLELLQPITSTAVVVRFQADTLTPACAIYTTLSQSTSPRPLEAVDAVSHTIDLSTVECGNYGSISPELQAWSDDLRSSGSGGNKRMLSPSNSIELSPESQQQQKRVKEEEVFDTPSSQEPKTVTPSCQTSECSPVSQAGPSYPSLQSSTCNSWCYLNYIKPNPATLDEQKPSVYSSWSTSGYDPNPLGLSSKTALSLVHCKQRLSPTIYTTSTMSATTDEEKEQENTKRPSSPEVYNKALCVDSSEAQQLANSSNKSVEEEKTREKQWMSEKRSNEKCSSQREDCRVNHKDTSVLLKCTHVSTQAIPYSTYSNVAFESDESFTKATVLKPVEETCCDPDDKRKVHDLCPADPQKAKDIQITDVDKAGQSEYTIRKDSSVRPAEAKGTLTDSENVSASEAPPLTPVPRDSTQRTSASVRRALFARRRFQPTACSPPGGSPQPQEKELSPPRSQPNTPPRCSVPTLTCSSPCCHVISSSERSASPVRCLSPRIVHSLKAGSSGSPGSQANTSAQDCTQSRVRLSLREIDVPRITPHPARTREAHNLLSHLPLHSQQASRAPSLLIPIGGIHMIQPRPSLRLFSSTAAHSTGTTNPCKRTDAPQQIQNPSCPPASRPNPQTSRELSDNGGPKGELPLTLQVSSSNNEVRLSPQKVD